jgi:hypothetical protein
MDKGTILVYCCASIFSLTSPPPPVPKLNVHYKQTVCVWGGDELCCRPYSAGILHSVSDQIQNLPNCFTTPNKMTSEDDITGLVSLNILRPWSQANLAHHQQLQQQHHHHMDQLDSMSDGGFSELGTPNILPYSTLNLFYKSNLYVFVLLSKDFSQYISIYRKNSSPLLNSKLFLKFEVIPRIKRTYPPFVCLKISHRYTIMT